MPKRLTRAIRAAFHTIILMIVDGVVLFVLGG